MKHILSVIVALSFLLTFGHAGVEVLHYDSSTPNPDGTYNAVNNDGQKVVLDMQNGTATTVPTSVTIKINPWLLGGLIFGIVLLVYQSVRHTRALKDRYELE